MAPENGAQSRFDMWLHLHVLFSKAASQHDPQLLSSPLSKLSFPVREALHEAFSEHHGGTTNTC